ncbi:hypothetical protein ACRYI5_01410 [Furfurilactobacillus sp. WILCCON 0119]
MQQPQRNSRHGWLILVVLCLFGSGLLTLTARADTGQPGVASSSTASQQAAVTKNEDEGKLVVNQQVLEQQQSSNQQHGHSTKAADEIPDLFDPKYSKGLAKEQAQQQAGNKAAKHQVFAKKKLQVDGDVKGITKSKQHLFTSKNQLATSAGADPTATTGINGGHWLMIGAIMAAFVGAGVLLGFKGQKLLFRRRKHG